MFNNLKMRLLTVLFQMRQAHFLIKIQKVLDVKGAFSSLLQLPCNIVTVFVVLPGLQILLHSRSIWVIHSA